MQFETAISLMREGKRVRRADPTWRAVQHCIYLVNGSTFEVNRPPLNQHYAPGTRVTYEPHVDAVFTNRTCGVYSITNQDVLAHDWELDDAPLPT